MSESDRAADWTFSEAQRLAGLIHTRTQRATFNVISAIAVAIVPAIALSGTIDPRWYLAGPVLLSLMPLMMLEEDKETIAIGHRLNQLEKRVNAIIREPLMVTEEAAKRDTVLPTRYALYGLFVLIWLASWVVGFFVLFTYDTNLLARIGYVALAISILSFAVISAMSREALANRAP